MNANRKIGLKEHFMVVLFLVFWIVPIGFVGLFDRDLEIFPSRLSYLHRVSCLFPNSQWRWPVYHVQVVSSESSGGWTLLDERVLFQMKPFGYWNRFQILLVWSEGDRGLLLRRELADWLKKHYELENNVVEVQKLRFLRAYHTVSDDNLPEGHWKRPSLDISSDEFFVLDQYEF